MRRRGPSGPQAPITGVEAERVLASAERWDEPAGRAADQVLPVATPAGAEAFRSP